ncbi:MAG: DedA family protein [Spirochaetes bacterium]|nr:MAG: DedA family protein [Spirochaetota bacterium]
METTILELLDKVLACNEALFYLFLFVSAVIENLFPPIPGDTITAFGAFLVGTGRLNYFLVYGVTTLGSVVGFMLLFFLGRFMGKEFFMNKNYSFFSSKSILSAEAWFRRFGYPVVAGNRFLPGIRSVISLVSGISMLSPARVLALSVASAAVWNFIWIHAGFMLGTNWDAVRGKTQTLLRNYNLAVGAIMLAAAVVYVIYRVRRSAKERAGSAA